MRIAPLLRVKLMKLLSILIQAELLIVAREHFHNILL